MREAERKFENDGGGSTRRSTCRRRRKCARRRTGQQQNTEESGLGMTSYYQSIFGRIMAQHFLMTIDLILPFKTQYMSRRAGIGEVRAGTSGKCRTLSHLQQQFSASDVENVTFQLSFQNYNEYVIIWCPPIAAAWDPIRPFRLHPPPNN